MTHWHHCPECYEKYPCDMDCTIEPDLFDNGREFGAHCICFVCEEKAMGEAKYKTKEFWLRYNGFIK